MALHKNWRDCKAWQDEKLKMSTTSNEACKMYDALVTQVVGWYEDKTVGGMAKTMENIKSADPNFVMGHAICNAMSCLGGKTVINDADFKREIDTMVRLAKKSDITPREQLHVNAVKYWSEGYIPEATDVLEEILLDNPTDMFAIKFAHTSYFYMGHQAELRDSIARVIPHWKPHIPNYGYLMGMYGFGLVETNMFDKAEKWARKGLDINPCDVWSAHAISHVLEMTGKQQEGIDFLSNIEQDWLQCDMLVSHVYWHWALFHIERGEYEEALTIYDDKLVPLYQSSAGVGRISNTGSLLQRLEVNGINVGDRWRPLYDEAKLHTEDHTLAYSGFHVMMACAASKELDASKHMLDSAKQFVSKENTCNNHIKKVMSEVGEQLYGAIDAYGREDYSMAVDLLYPIRYKLTKFGGSDAQRDVFNLMLINSAIKSPNERHHKLARQLLIERKAFRENTPMTDRLMEQIMALHLD